MSETARRYAEACFGLPIGTERFLNTARSIMDCPPLRKALQDPSIDWREKERVLDRLPFFDGVPPLRNFYKLLARKGRMKLLPEIADAFRGLELETRNAADCEMRCVHAPDPARQEKLKKMLCSLHHRGAVQLNFIIDPTLLGGFVLKIDGVTYDRSVRGRLCAMTRQLQERSAR